MKRWIWLIVLTLMAVPALAQDEGGGGGGDFFDLSSMGEFGSVAPDFDPLLEVRNMLAQAKVTPMDKKQEKDLKKIYDKEVKVVAKPYEQRFNLNLKTTMGSLQASSARGRRGGGGGGGGGGGEVEVEFPGDRSPLRLPKPGVSRSVSGQDDRRSADRSAGSPKKTSERTSPDHETEYPYRQCVAGRNSVDVCTTQ